MYRQSPDVSLGSYNSWILKQNSQFIAVLCGDGPLMEPLIQMAHRLNVDQNIRFVGFSRDIKKIFSFMDLMILPSLTEGLPNVVLEAFAAKKPVAVTKVGGVPELVTDQENGYIVPAADPNALAEAINKLVNDKNLRMRMGKHGFDTVKKSFSFDDQNEVLENIYMDFANAR